jgi:hypothetical protein
MIEEVTFEHTRYRNAPCTTPAADIDNLVMALTRLNSRTRTG